MNLNNNQENYIIVKEEKELKVIEMKESKNRFNFSEEKLICHNHEERIMLYCESCEEGICKECKQSGPHNTRVHKTGQIKEIVYRRAQAMQEMIEGDLKDKNRQITSQMENIDERSVEIQRVARLIRQDIVAQWDGISDRLISHTGQKTAILQSELAILQKSINKIQDITDTFKSLKQSGHPLDLLLIQGQLTQKTNNMMCIQFKQEIEETPYDLTREVEQLNTLLSSLPALSTTNRIKSNVIKSIATDIKGLKISKEDYNCLLKDSIQLTTKFSSAYKSQILLCFYCHVLIDSQQVNQKCPSNKHPLLPEGFLSISTNQPPKTYHANHKHYFCIPKDTLLQTKLHQIPQLNNYHSAIQLYTVSLHLYHVYVQLLRSACQANKIDLRHTLSQFDKGNGYVKKVQFEYILEQTLGMDEDMIVRSTGLLGKEGGMIDYMELVKMVEDHTYIDSLLELNCSDNAFTQTQDHSHFIHNISSNRHQQYPNHHKDISTNKTEDIQFYQPQYEQRVSRKQIEKKEKNWLPLQKDLITQIGGIRPSNNVQ